MAVGPGFAIDERAVTNDNSVIHFRIQFCVAGSLIC
jgi:hypothetical protein